MESDINIHSNINSIINSNINGNQNRNLNMNIKIKGCIYCIFSIPFLIMIPVILKGIY